jgi:hypothetical protein
LSHPCQKIPTHPSCCTFRCLQQTENFIDTDAPTKPSILAFFLKQLEINRVLQV